MTVPQVSPEALLPMDAVQDHDNYRQCCDGGSGTHCDCGTCAVSEDDACLDLFTTW